MVSFDIESLFTNVPLHETIEICVNKLFANSSLVHGFGKRDFRKMLELAVLNSSFQFDGKFYRQIEGLGMGLPLGPTFANLFMCHHEVTWMDECPLAHRPVHYFRYLDDTCLFFKKKIHAEKFLEYINQKHPSIRFTAEFEAENTLPFLDINITRTNHGFVTNVFRKST